MAFEYRKFSDGEVTFKTPQWQRNLEAIDFMNEPINFSQSMEDKRTYKSNDIGFRHPENGSFIRIKEDGTIEAFTGYGTGMRIKTDQTIQLFGDKIQHIGREVGFTTSPNYQVNNQAYETYPKTKGLSQESIIQMKSAGVNTYDIEEWK